MITLQKYSIGIILIFISLQNQNCDFNHFVLYIFKGPLPELPKIHCYTGALEQHGDRFLVHGLRTGHRTYCYAQCCGARGLYIHLIFLYAWNILNIDRNKGLMDKLVSKWNKLVVIEILDNVIAHPETWIEYRFLLISFLVWSINKWVIFSVIFIFSVIYNALIH